MDEIWMKLVTGFIRLSSKDIPMDIVNLCLSFYVMVETFHAELHGQDLVVSNSEDGNEHLVLTYKKNETWQSAMGSFNIDSSSYKDSIIQWTLKLAPLTFSFFGFVIGIVEETKDHNFDSQLFGNLRKQKNYGWQILVSERLQFLIQKRMGKDGEFQMFSSSDPILRKGQNEDNIFNLMLKIPNKSLACVVNGKELESFENIDMTVFYRLVLAFYTKGTMVEIIDFEISTAYTNSQKDCRLF